MSRFLILAVVLSSLWHQFELVAAETIARIEVEMRDGVKLETTVWRPGDGVYPVVLARGYSANGLSGASSRWNENGYCFVSQQTRGNGGEDGSRFFVDDQDGYDCIQWIAQQPWCNGKVAMWGGSYWGITQWRAAVAQPPALKAIIPGYNSVAYCGWENGYWRRGVLHLKMTSQGRVFSSNARYSPDQWKRNLMYLPLIDMDRKFSGQENTLWNEYIQHSANDEYWKATSMAEQNRYARIRTPVYIMSGWRDYYADSSLAAFAALKKLGLAPDVRVRIDDRGHSGMPDFAESVRFLDYHLKGLDNGVADEPSVKLFVRNAGWEQPSTWPPTNLVPTQYYFSSRNGHRLGTLQTTTPTTESPTAFTYDPQDPVLTLGANGSHTIPEVAGLISDDSVDQSANENRPDVLVFTSERLAEDLKIIGPVEARIFAATSATDTDFVVRLLDVTPEGRVLNITEGVVRARFRNGRDSEPSLITPAEIYDYRVQLSPIAITFKKGHRLRVHVTSSCFPLWDRNPNTGDPIGMSGRTQIAQQTIYHSHEYPSHIQLPVAGDHPASSQPQQLGN